MKGGTGALALSSQNGHLDIARQLVQMGLSVHDSNEVVQLNKLNVKIRHISMFRKALLHFFGHVRRDTSKLLCF